MDIDSVRKQLNEAFERAKKGKRIIEIPIAYVLLCHLTSTLNFAW